MASVPDGVNVYDYAHLLSEEEINRIIDEETEKLKHAVGACDCCNSVEFQQRLAKLEAEFAEVRESWDASSKLLEAAVDNFGSFIAQAAAPMPSGDAVVPCAPGLEPSDSEDSESTDSVATFRSALAEVREGGRSARHALDALANSLNELGVAPSLLPTLKAKDVCFAIFKKGDQHFYPAEVLGVTFGELKSGDQAVALQSVRVKFLGHNTGVSPGIRYFGPAAGSSAECDPKSVAFAKPVDEKLPIAARVVAHYSESSFVPREGWCAGVVAEQPSVRTNFRYLIFFDDGYVQYCTPERVLPMVASSTDAWMDMDCDDASRDFYRNYFAAVPEKAMVRLALDSQTRIESNGAWWNAKILRVDCSLIQVKFLPEENAEHDVKPAIETEWIYRGSSRFAAIYLSQKENANTSLGSRRTLARSTFSQPQQPLEYVRLDQSSNSNDSSSARGSAEDSSRHVTTTQYVDYPRLYQLRHYEVFKSERAPFIHDRCTPACLGANNAVDDPRQCRAMNDRYFSPLLIPLMCGWSRESALLDASVQVCYTSPCGRRFRDGEELCRYLLDMKSKLAIDLFCFDSNIDLFRFVEALRVKVQGADYSRGREQFVRVPWTNNRDDKKPCDINYCAWRKPSGQTVLNVNSGFASCCDCTDNCLDKTKCSCQQLTAKHASLVSDEVPLADAANLGYSLRRLNGRFVSGIFECNQGCKCLQSACVNRVVQNPVQVRLEIFKTAKKGFGVRAVDDIPKGTFVCTYSGIVVSPAECEAVDEGNAYLTELDLIEKMEQEKHKGIANGQDFLGSTASSKAEAVKTKRTVATDSADLRKQRSEGEAARSSNREGKGKIVLDNGIAVQGGQHSLRMLYNESDAYVIDARSYGNVGRYFNHSCSPNMFVQNVFVDTHDLRFPWVGFFTSELVLAGTELCWDYGYIVNSVAGTRIKCRCGSLNCRGRLL